MFVKHELVQVAQAVLILTWRLFMFLSPLVLLALFLTSVS